MIGSSVGWRSCCSSTFFFPWYTVTVSAAEFSVSESFTAIQAPYAWPAILAVLILLALLADLALQRFRPPDHDSGGRR